MALKFLIGAVQMSLINMSKARLIIKDSDLFCCRHWLHERAKKKLGIVSELGWVFNIAFQPLVALWILK